MSYLLKTVLLTSVTCTMASDLKIQFCVVGAQKAASSYLQFAIDEHPDIYAPKGETTFFEDDEYDRLKSSDYTVLSGRYEQVDQKIIGIKRPTYLTNPSVPQRLYDHNSKMKIIAILRNPLKRFFSAYHHLVKSGYLAPISIDIFLDECMKNPNVIHKNLRVKSLFEYGLYADGLQNYFRLFPPENVKVVFTEDLSKNRDRVIREIYEFLEVENYIPKISKSARPMKSVSNQIRLKMWNYMNSHLCTFSDDRMRSYGPATQTARVLLKFIKIFDEAFLSKIFVDSATGLLPRHEQYLFQYYVRDMEVLEQLVNFELKKWKSV